MRIVILSEPRNRTLPSRSVSKEGISSRILLSTLWLGAMSTSDGMMHFVPVPFPVTSISRIFFCIYIESLAYNSAEKNNTVIKKADKSFRAIQKLSFDFKTCKDRKKKWKYRQVSAKSRFKFCLGLFRNFFRGSFLFYLHSGRGHRNYIFSFAERIKRYVTVRYVA